MGTLIRESDPPAGKVASPIPQYRLVGTGDTYEAVEGQNGASFTIMTDVDGNPITDNNGLLVRSDDIAQETTLSSIDTKVATETTLDTRLSSLETKMDTLLNSQDEDNNITTKQSGSIASTKTEFDNDDIVAGQTRTLFSIGKEVKVHEIIIDSRPYS